MDTFTPLGLPIGPIRRLLSSVRRWPSLDGGDAARPVGDPAFRNRHPGSAIYLGWWLLVMALVVAQDYVNAWYWGRAFYWSECLLFNSYWLWFLPLTLVWLGGRLRMVDRWWSLLGGALLFSILHLLITALWVDWASSIWLDSHFRFAKLWPKFLARDLYKGIVVYGLIGLLVRYRKEPVALGPFPAIQLPEESPLSVRIGTRQVRLPIADIDWMAKEGAYVCLHCGSKKYLHRTTLQQLLEDYSGGPFLRIHRSYVVNIDRVSAYRSRRNGDYDLILQDTTVLRLSRRYREAVLTRLRRSARHNPTPGDYSA